RQARGELSGRVASLEQRVAGPEPAKFQVEQADEAMLDRGKGILARILVDAELIDRPQVRERVLREDERLTTSKRGRRENGNLHVRVWRIGVFRTEQLKHEFFRAGQHVGLNLPHLRPTIEPPP